jgi:hypothetical protein
MKRRKERKEYERYEVATFFLFLMEIWAGTQILRSSRNYKYFQ